MKKFLLYAAIVAIFAACNPDEGGKGGNSGNSGVSSAELSENSYAIDGKVSQFGSTAVLMLGDNISIVATPTAGVATAEAILECDEYLFASVNPLLLDKSFDLKSESSLFTFISTLSGAQLESVAPDMTNEISAGTAKFTYENKILVVKADLTLVSGTTLSLYARAEQQVVVNENTMSCGNTKKVVRSAFYMEEGGKTALYFGSGEVEYFEEFENVVWQTYIMVDNAFVDGVKHNVDASSIEAFGMVDLLNESNSVAIDADNLQGATGSYTISKTGDGAYSVEIAVMVNGLSYAVSFVGECVSVDLAPEVKSNYLLFDNKEYSISAATLTKGESVWSVEFVTSSGKSLLLTAPAKCFDGNTYGFSQSADLTLSYDGVTYSKANGYSGSLTAEYNAANQNLTAEFSNYDNLQFSYAGSVTVVE